MAPLDAIPGREDAARFTAHWTIFLPAAIVTAVYGGLWVFLLAVDMGNSALARLMLLVLFLVVPVMLVRAYLRFASFRLRVGRQVLTYKRGWLRPHWHRVELGDLAGARAIPSPLGRLYGAGVLVISQRGNDDIRLYDVADAEEAARQIRRRLAA